MKTLAKLPVTIVTGFLMRELVARRGDLDQILIETSGLALPKPLVQAFQWPEIRNACTVDAVITVV
ncbi:hypothetical protein D6C67_24285, partial [Escherichia coli]|uniref:CobW-like GTP-binding protein n=1 Tax=Escherichia coli TaxID=562 RepID=UPI000FF5AE43